MPHWVQRSCISAAVLKIDVCIIALAYYILDEYVLLHAPAGSSYLLIACEHFDRLNIGKQGDVNNMQYKSKFVRSLFIRPIMALLIALPSTHIAAQEQIESSDSISYIVDDRPREGVERSYDITPQGITMRVSSTDGNQQPAEIWITDTTDHVRARVTMSSETDAPLTGDDGVRLRISGTWYNEIQDGGLGNGDRTGDVYGQARIRLRDQDRREFSLCLDRRLADGSNEGVNIFDGENCIAIPNFVPEYDTEYEIYMALDRTASTIAFGIDGQEIVTPIGQPVYLPEINNKQIQITHEGAAGQAVGVVSAIGTDGDLQDFSVMPLASGPYRPLFDLERGNSDLTYVDERVRYEVRAPADATERTGLTVFGNNQKIEATIELSSDSVVGAPVTEDDDAFVFVRLGGTFYNDTAEDGFNENEGNVFSTIVLRQNDDDSLELQYCLFRSDDADFSTATELVMQDGTECGEFTTVAELDTSYNVAINSDLAEGTVTFAVDEEEQVHPITTAAFLPANDRQFINVQTRATAGSTAIAYLDNFGTSADAPLVNMAATAGSDSTDSTDSTDSSSGGGGGGGGCSVGSVNHIRDPMLLVLGLIAFVGLANKRKRESVRS